jgi:hypothetical protein
MKKPKLLVYDIRLKFGYRRAWLMVAGVRMVLASRTEERKNTFVSRCAKWCRVQATEQSPFSLRIHSVDGRILEERTYPRSADPRRSKG